MINTVILLVAISNGEPSLVSMYGTQKACVKSAKERMLLEPKKSYQCKPYKFNVGYVKE
jgi:hypothetical protein